MAAQYTIRAKKLPKKTVLIAAVSLLLVLIAVIVVWQTGVLLPRPEPLAIGFPGSVKESSSSMQLNEQEARRLEGRMNALLALPDRSLASWYHLAGRGNAPPAVRSEERMPVDQLRYGQFLVEQERRRDFMSWWTAFRQTFLQQNGRLRLLSIEQTDCAVRDNLLLLRILAQSSTLWPDQSRYSDLLGLSDAMLADMGEGIPATYEIAVPTPGPILDPAATPTPKPEIEPTPAPDEQPRRMVLRISSIDLYSMQQLGSIDSRWSALYDKYLPIVQGAYLSDNLPLYALGYDNTSGAYIPYAGENPLVSTEDSMLVLLHLSEVGAAPERSISWIMDQVFNQRAVFTSYHLTLATPISDTESLPSYAMICRIARMRGDETLYEQSVQRLLWHQATSQTSEAFSALFREPEPGEYQVWAVDNTWALLAIR